MLITCVLDLCFIYSVFLGNIKEAFDKNQNLSNLLLDDFFKSAIINAQVSLIFV